MGEYSREAYEAAEAEKEAAKAKLEAKEKINEAVGEDEYLEKDRGYSKDEIKTADKKMDKLLGTAQKEAIKLNKEYERLINDPNTTPEELENIQKKMKG